LQLFKVNSYRSYVVKSHPCYKVASLGFRRLMSKQFSKTINFKGTVDQVLEMFRSPKFLEKIAKESISHSIKVDFSGNFASVYLEIETDEIPSLAKKLVGRTITIFDTQELPLKHVESGVTTGKRTIRSSVKQIQAEADLKFESTSDGSKVLYEGKVKFDFPVGKSKAEKELLEIVITGINKLEKMGNRWLSDVATQ
jgi:Protein of unknown function (DUF2505)